MEPQIDTLGRGVAAARRLLAGGGGHPELSRIARLAAKLLDSGSAQVSLLTEVQTVAGRAGTSAPAVGVETPLSESMCTVTASCGGPLLVRDTHADARVSHLAVVTSGGVGSYLGVPLVANGGETVGALCVFDAAPHDWSAADVAVLEQLAASTVAELELAALAGEFENSRARWELAIDAAGIGSFDWDLVTGHLAWDDTLLIMFGYDADSFDGTIDAFNARLHPDDLERVSQALQHAIDTVGAYSAEYRILLPSGAIRWIQARGRAIGDETGKTGRVMGAASDVTGRRDSEAQVVRVLESMSAAFVAVDRTWRLTYVNAEAERLLRMSRTALTGGDMWELFPALLGSAFEGVYRAAMAGRPGIVEAYYPSPLGGWYEVRASPAPDGLSLNILDVTARRTAQNLARLTAQVSEQLSRSLAADDAVQDLARLVVPQLGDWSMVSMVQPETAPSGPVQRETAGWHVDPLMRPVVDRYIAARRDAPRRPGPVDQALQSMAPVIVKTGATVLALRELTSPAAIEAVTQLATDSAVVLPMAARGHLIGALTVCRGAGRPAMSAQEIQAAAGIADRAGLALDNAALFTEQRSTARQLRAANDRLQVVAEHNRTVARALQDAMLTTLPEPDSLRLAARYLTATGTEQVGGDWYDAMILPGGATTLMIGDVAGHDIAAAAAMGQLRNMLRAFAWDHHTDPPSALVGRLDGAMRDLNHHTLATLVLLRVEQTAHDRSAGPRTLRWTNAGHPPPVLVHADGTAVVLPTSNDLLLGVDPEFARRNHSHPAPPNSTLILYTDGLIETRTADIDAGQARLLDVLRTYHRLDPGELLDAVLADMVGSQPDDDVAVLAVRFHPQDGLRPPGAGPP